ncbi:CGNR zinc finger domain-containing protein [Rhizobium sp. NTR19]|uniref:CGNR zinc finger domain-containing protein n=1 Tax=Neorhizobium turbinariae TaxID=2937795 RepID=A0ABT0IXC7_9HYPH|nr:CGNR zinc finger domain-containing protein [Neorhizobium turbinariae]MCK8782528.1 CGNR zinc finger domain-containing protein [Neorhizobium turbinariae]
MASSTKDMRLIGGHPALDLVNTVDSRGDRWGPDFIQVFDDVLVLAERLELVEPKVAGKLRRLLISSAADAEGLVKEVIALREALHEVFLAEDAGGPYPKAAIEIVAGWARRGRVRQVFKDDNGVFGWTLPFDSFEDVPAKFALEATALITERPHRRPVRECKGDNCGWLFLDHSKSGRRLWCSDASCGTHNRVKRFRARHAPDKPSRA